MTARLRILIVSKDAETIRQWIKGNSNYESFHLSIHISMDGLDGLRKVQMYMPVFVIVDNDLPDINGLSFASIAKDSIEGQESSILVFGVNTFTENIKADFFLPLMPVPQLKQFINVQLESFLKNRFIMESHRAEFEKQKQEQLRHLPKTINNSWADVSNIFSPYDELSGDGFDYWFPQKKDGILYGFLYDCTGHGPESYPLVSSVRSLLTKNLKLYEYKRFQTLADVMKSSNSTIMDTTPINELTPTAAVAFCINFIENKLIYCAAGIPTFFVRYKGVQGFDRIKCSSFLLGMFETSSYEEEEMSISGIEELVFSSDGFSEILYSHNSSPEAKHDDVSAVSIRFKETNKDVVA